MVRKAAWRVPPYDELPKKIAILAGVELELEPLDEGDSVHRFRTYYAVLDDELALEVGVWTHADLGTWFGTVELGGEELVRVTASHHALAAQRLGVALVDALDKFSRIRERLAGPR